MSSEEIWHFMGIVASECVFSRAAIVTLIVSQCMAYRFALLI
ncbi:hypothetical protein [Enterobacter asburiae]|nr:hypothetical protein [Enterobacter asburiae]